MASFSLHASQKWLRTGKSTPSWQHIAAVYPKQAGFGKICAPCIRKAPQIAVRGCITRISCQEGALFAARTPRIMHTAQILPSVAAEQRERSQARRRPYGAAACLGTAEQGAGGFLSGGVGRCRRSAWRCGGIERAASPSGAARSAPPFVVRIFCLGIWLAVRALGASSVPLDEKVSPLVLFALTIPPRGI